MTKPSSTSSTSRPSLFFGRNHLLSRALADEDWVLWLDVDVIDYPADIIERPLATGKDIVHPHCIIPLIRDDNSFSVSQGEIETEGMGVLASDMGYEYWGMPNLEILHHPYD
jgi:hypothetical protein